MKTILALALALSLLGALAACSSGAATTSTSTTSSPPPTTSAPPTFGTHADAGKVVFGAKCAKCHGNNGEGVTGPALIGSGANLAKYNTSQALLAFSARPCLSTLPGSLSSGDYTNILAFLMVQNTYLSANAAFDASVLTSVQLKK